MREPNAATNVTLYAQHLPEVFRIGAAGGASFLATSKFQGVPSINAARGATLLYVLPEVLALQHCYTITLVLG